MDEVLRITDLTFDYGDLKLFDSLDLTLNYNEWYTLIGKNGSGKTTLVKLICGLIDNYEGNIEFNFLNLNDENLFEIRTRMSVLFSNVDDLIVEDNVYDEITFEMKNMDYNKELIEQSIEEISEYTHINDFIDKDLSELTIEEKYLLILTSALIIKPKLLIIDETFSKLDKNLRKELYHIINLYRENNKLTVLNISQNLEDSLIGDKIILLEEGKIKFNENVKKVYDEKLITEENYDLPFIVELSEYLKLYEVTKENYYDMEEMVDALWKLHIFRQENIWNNRG